MATSTPVALSALHQVHLALGADMADGGSWQRPSSYTSAEAEFDGLRNAVGLCDVSPAGKLLVQGEDIDAYLGTAFSEIADLPGGRVLRRQPKGAGSHATLARLAGDEVLVFTGPGQATAFAETLGEAADRCVHAVDVTSALAGIKIAGPRSHHLLAAVTELDTSPQAFDDLSCAQARIAEVHGTLLRLDAGDLPSYELYVDRGYAEYIWEALMEAGAHLGVVPFGSDALAQLGTGE